MKYQIKFSRFYILLILISLPLAVYAGIKNSGSGKLAKTNEAVVSTATTGKVGDAYRFRINNINMPLNRKGVIADVNIPDPVPQISGSGGKFGGDVFLFSAGFFLSGKANGKEFANAVASATLVEDYVPGTVALGQSDQRAQLYVIKDTDPEFGTSWQDWKDAVDLGADFYDGNNDGEYSPEDLNGNDKWDTDEDRPDLIGDETVWCVYNDGLQQSQRRWNTEAPLGIEVRQTVFGFSSTGAIGNIVFVRYRFKYVGLNKPEEPNQLDDVYFGVWADPDIGDPVDDLVGSDVGRNVGYTYNEGSDGNELYGDQPPAFFIDFFTGPVSYVPGETFVDNNANGIYDETVDSPLDTAFRVQGQVKGVVAYPGAKNLGISSFVQYINGDPKINDPDNAEQARNYMLGLDRDGSTIDPCDFSYGQVRGVDCKTVDNRFWYSGDPVTNTGWINTIASDSRQMQNIGPFILEKGIEKEVVVAYVVGKGANAIDAISRTRKIDDGAQSIFDNNFLAPSPPPAPIVEVTTGEHFIDLSWDTPVPLSYNKKTPTYDIRFRGFNVYAYKTFSNEESINNQPNQFLIASYQVDNFIDNLYVEDEETSGIVLADPKSANRLPYEIYTDPVRGRIRLRINKDPFSKDDIDLVKGKPYYFAVTSTGVNFDVLVNRQPGGSIGDKGDYYLSKLSFVQNNESNKNLYIATLGENMYDPPLEEIKVEQSVGGASGIVQYDVVDKDALTGDTYTVEFLVDSIPDDLLNPVYESYWKLTNKSKEVLLVDSSKQYLYGSDKIDLPLNDGFLVKISEEIPELDTLGKIQTTGSVFNLADVYYTSKDVPQTRRIPLNQLNGLNSNYVRADQLRRVELRFTPENSGKAYRYLNGFFGNASQQNRFYKYAEAITDTINKGPVGEWDAAGGKAIGFVNVPFTAWVKDFETGEERQLAVGFIERRISYGGNPDGKWNPGTNLSLSGEYIIIFNSAYDPTGSQIAYKGGFQNGNSIAYADLNGGGTPYYPLPETAPYTQQERAIASSPLFDILYAVGLQKTDAAAGYTSGDKVVIEVVNYPYTPKDVYTFVTPSQGKLTQEQQKQLFEKVNVFPNPLYGYNPATSYSGGQPDAPFVTFSNLPEDVTIKIYSLSGILLRTLTTNDKGSATSSFLNWDLQNESGLRVASGLYIAIVSSPLYGEKILKFSIILPQKQIQRY